jgi:hypothetical protein
LSASVRSDRVTGGSESGPDSLKEPRWTTDRPIAARNSRQQSRDSASWCDSESRRRSGCLRTRRRMLPVPKRVSREKAPVRDGGVAVLDCCRRDVPRLPARARGSVVEVDVLAVEAKPSSKPPSSASVSWRSSRKAPSIQSDSTGSARGARRGGSRSADGGARKEEMQGRTSHEGPDHYADDDGDERDPQSRASALILRDLLERRVDGLVGAVDNSGGDCRTYPGQDYSAAGSPAAGSSAR